jgi:hypothetical protein
MNYLKEVQQVIDVTEIGDEVHRWVTDKTYKVLAKTDDGWFWLRYVDDEENYHAPITVYASDLDIWRDRLC